MISLDLEVAEKIMGWKWYTALRKSFLVPPHAFVLFDLSEGFWVLGRGEQTRYFEDGVYPEYQDALKLLPFSSNMSHAMEVVGALSDTYGFVLGWSRKKKLYTAVFSRKNRRTHELHKYGFSSGDPAFAICGAALKAKEATLAT